MKKMLAKFSVPVLVAGGISGVAVGVAAPASAGCAGAGYGVGVSSRCDGPMQPDGWFRRCDMTYVFGFGGQNCYMVDSNNLAGNPPWIP